MDLIHVTLANTLGIIVLNVTEKMFQPNISYETVIF